MNSKHIHTVVISSLFLLSTITPSLHARNRRDSSCRAEEIVTGALVVGGVAAGIYALGSWLFGTTDEEVVDKARNCQYEANKRYASMMNLLEGKTKEYLPEVEVLRIPPESFLEAVSAEITATSCTRSGYRNDLSELIDALRKQKKEVYKRACKCNSQFMHELVQELDATIAKLEAIYNFVNLHYSYFALDVVERSLYIKYAQENALIEKHSNNLPELTHQLRGIVARYGAGCRSSYPYLDYVDQIKSDKFSLDELIAATHGKYKELAADSCLLSSRLDLVVRELTADPEYMRSLRDRERERREQAERERMLALERERIRLEREAQRQRDILIAQQREQARQQERILAAQRAQELERIRLERERLALGYDPYYYPHAEVYIGVEFSD